MSSRETLVGYPSVRVFARKLRTITCLALALAGMSCASDLDVAKSFELGRFEGRWYEIARIPREYDELCHDTQAEYRRLGRDKLELRHTCRIGSPNGAEHESRATASVDDPATPAKLSLQIGLYTGAYWVLDAGDDYEYAVIGHPSRMMLWVLSREPQLEDSKWRAILASVQKQGFSTDLLKRTPQSTKK